MPEPMTLAGVLTEVEDAHLKVMDAASSIVMCICGEWVAMYVGGSPGDDRDHRAHVRAEQVRAVREWLAGEEVREAVCTALRRTQESYVNADLPDEFDPYAAAALAAVRDRCC